MAVPDGWPPARVRAGAQNPAYRPARPPPALLTRISAGPGSIRGHTRVLANAFGDLSGLAGVRQPTLIFCPPAMIAPRIDTRRVTASGSGSRGAGLFLCVPRAAGSDDTLRACIGGYPSPRAVARV
jgi:hypothetical protein